MTHTGSYAGTHTCTHTCTCAHTHTHRLILTTKTGLCEHVSGVDVLWSERIGYTGSEPESDFSQSEGHYKPNGTAKEKVARYSPVF